MSGQNMVTLLCTIISLALLILASVTVILPSVLPNAAAAADRALPSKGLLLGGRAQVRNVRAKQRIVYDRLLTLPGPALREGYLRLLNRCRPAHHPC